MNYAKEKFPEDINKLILKCEDAIIKIERQFSDSRCLIVKDLYHQDKGHKQKDFVQKLQLTCNAKLNQKVKTNNEVTGLYVFGEIETSGIVKPVYIGISRTIFRRLYQHTWGKTHNETSFSYLKAKHFTDYKGNRNNLPLTDLCFQQEKIKNYRLVVIPEDLEYDLYFMEVYIAGRLKTKWNSFKTH